MGREKEFENTTSEFGFRKYDEETGSFLQPDPLWAMFPDQSPFQYGYNSPLNLSDASGLFNETATSGGGNASSGADTWFCFLRVLYGVDGCDGTCGDPEHGGGGGGTTSTAALPTRVAGPNGVIVVPLAAALPRGGWASGAWKKPTPEPIGSSAPAFGQQGINPLNQPIPEQTLTPNQGSGIFGGGAQIRATTEADRVCQRMTIGEAPVMEPQSWLSWLWNGNRSMRVGNTNYVVNREGYLTKEIAPIMLIMPDVATKGGTGLLTGAVKSNFLRFLGKIPANSKSSAAFEVLEDGNYLFSATSPGKVAGSSALYQKWVNIQGETVKMLKTTFGPDGKIIHVKQKF